VSGSYAYVADGATGLRVIDVANRAAPMEVGFCDTPGFANDVALAGDYAYVADEGGSLRILDISNPATPTEISSCSTTGFDMGVTLAGQFAYVTDMWGGLAMVNILKPWKPMEIAYRQTPGYSYGAAIVQGYAYVADSAAGMTVLRIPRYVLSTIVPQGGSLASADAGTQFVFPAGTFTATIDLTYDHLWTDQNTASLAGIGRTFDLTAVYSDTGQVAPLAPGHTFTATLHYTDAERGGAIESTLALYSWDGSAWVREPTSVLDAGTNTITAAPNHLGLFAVLGNTLRLTLPVVVKRN